MTEMDLGQLPRERLEEITTAALEALNRIRPVVERETFQAALVKQQVETIKVLTQQTSKLSAMLASMTQNKENREEIFRSALLQARSLLMDSGNGEKNPVLDVIETALGEEVQQDPEEPEEEDAHPAA
jgi:ribosomal protein L16 Arg81 hydroxylase